MSNLTDDEYAVLMICAEGQSMAAIARWEKPTDALVERGLLERADKFNNHITPAGREALNTHEKALHQHLAENGRKIVDARNQAQMSAEQAAQHIALAARASAAVTGDTLEQSARQWSSVAYSRALELLAQ